VAQAVGGVRRGLTLCCCCCCWDQQPNQQLITNYSPLLAACCLQESSTHGAAAAGTVLLRDTRERDLRRHRGGCAMRHAMHARPHHAPVAMHRAPSTTVHRAPGTTMHHHAPPCAGLHVFTPSHSTALNHCSKNHSLSPDLQIRAPAWQRREVVRRRRRGTRWGRQLCMGTWLRCRGCWTTRVPTQKPCSCSHAQTLASPPLCARLRLAVWRRLLLDHPSVDPEAMMALRNTDGTSVFVAAAEIAAGIFTVPPSCKPLLFLLRRVAVEPQPPDAQQAHMTQIMEALCQDIQVEDGEEDDEDEQHVEHFRSLFDDDQPDAARDECIHLLLEHGAEVFLASSPVMKRIIRECFAMARVPQRINEAVVGMAIARGQERPRHDAA
jgi:hypothetical protein